MMNTNKLNKNPWSWLWIESVSIIAALSIGSIAVKICWQYGWTTTLFTAIGFAGILFLLIRDKRKRYKRFVKEGTLVSFSLWNKLKKDNLV